MDWTVKYYPAYWQGKRLAYPDVPKEHPKFAQSIAIGNLIFVSGCVGQDTVSGNPAPTVLSGIGALLFAYGYRMVSRVGNPVNLGR